MSSVTTTGNGMKVTADAHSLHVELTWWGRLLAPKKDKKKQPIPTSITIPINQVTIVSRPDQRLTGQHWWQRGKLVLKSTSYPCPWKLGWLTGKPTPKYRFTYGPGKARAWGKVYGHVMAALMGEPAASPAPRQRSATPTTGKASQAGRPGRRMSADAATAGRRRKTA